MKRPTCFKERRTKKQKSQLKEDKTRRGKGHVPVTTCLQARITPQMASNAVIPVPAQEAMVNDPEASVGYVRLS